MVLYVWENEQTSRLKIIHFNDDEGGVPSELEANAKSMSMFCRTVTYSYSLQVLDEAFPEITIDLVSRLSFRMTGVALKLILDCRAWIIHPCQRSRGRQPAPNTSVAHVHELSRGALSLLRGGLWDSHHLIVAL